MARSFNEDEFTIRRTEILDAAQQLIYTRGYEQMTIQDILTAQQISKGAFYHYFRSKRELLEALIERMIVQMEQVLAPVVANCDLPALEKLDFFFGTIGSWKSARKELLLALLRVWYNDDNVLVREKLRTGTSQTIVPLLAKIICQGVQEGSMDTPYPEQAAHLMMSMGDSLSTVMFELVLSAQDGQRGILAQASTLMNAYTDAMERVLGITPGTVVAMNEETLRTWFD